MTVSISNHYQLVAYFPQKKIILLTFCHDKLFHRGIYRTQRKQKSFFPTGKCGFFIMTKLARIFSIHLVGFI